jgi:thiol-disulfide isomerase/thioredoxin
LDGRVYILSFFDTRCPDCVEEIQVLQRIYDKYHAVVPVLNVPRSQTKEDVQAYWDEKGLTMPFHTSDDNLYYQFANKTIPRTYVVDDEGKVYAAFNDSPVVDYESLDNILTKIVGEADAKRGPVNLSFKMKVPAASGDPSDYYFHNEYAISRLDIYFFNAATKAFFTKAMITDLTKAESLYDAKYDVTYVFDDVRLSTGVYDIFFVANYDNAPEEPANENELLNMIDSITYNSGIEANLPETGPVMTSNATAFQGVNLIPWINKSYVMNIELERVVAKLQIGVSQNSFQLVHNSKKYAEVNITNYKFVNLNQQYYLFQHKDSMPVFTAQPKFTLTENFSEYRDDGEQYVVDPLFYEKTLSTTNAAAFKDYYKSWFGNFTTENFAYMPSADNYGYAYILENTCFKTSQKNGYSPGIVFKAAVSPVFVYLYDNSSHALKEEYRPEYWPKVIYLYKYNFYGSIQAINIAGGLTMDELLNYTDEQLKVYGIKQIKFNMGVYETYYTYWIRHRNNSTNPMGAMEYGILRNNFYRMVVTDVKGIGNSTITPNIMRDNYPNSYADIEVD